MQNFLTCVIYDQAMSTLCLAFRSKYLGPVSGYYATYEIQAKDGPTFITFNLISSFTPSKNSQYLSMQV